MVTSFELNGLRNNEEPWAVVVVKPSRSKMKHGIECLPNKSHPAFDVQHEPFMFRSIQARTLV